MIFYYLGSFIIYLIALTTMKWEITGMFFIFVFISLVEFKKEIV